MVNIFFPVPSEYFDRSNWFLTIKNDKSSISAHNHFFGVSLLHQLKLGCFSFPQIDSIGFPDPPSCQEYFDVHWKEIIWPLMDRLRYTLVRSGYHSSHRWKQCKLRYSLVWATLIVKEATHSFSWLSSASLLSSVSLQEICKWIQMNSKKGCSSKLEAKCIMFDK